MNQLQLKKKNKDEVEEYKFLMIPAFANEPSNLKINIIEKTFFDDANEIKVKVEETAVLQCILLLL